MATLNQAEWQALLSEIRALARAGAPMDKALAGFARDVGGKVGQFSGIVAEHLARGKSLAESLAALGRPDAAACSALIEAAAKSGDLPETLDVLLTSSAANTELRRRLTTALVYPTMLALFAFMLLALGSVGFAPSITQFAADYQIRSNALNWTLPVMQATGAATACLAILMAATGAAMAFGMFPGWLIILQPRFRRWPDLVRAARFSELMAMLIERSVPLGNALRLAGDAAGGRELQRVCHALAAACESGEAAPLSEFRELEHRKSGLPASVFLLLAGTADAKGLEQGFRRTAQVCQREIDDLLDAAQTRMPLLLLATIGGSVVLLCGLCQFVPFVMLMRRLAID